ncbi:cytochrome P450 monooxygenase pc-3 [Panaeolus papilionaceus]|nr:cytochrome P450 monooxygenase pc-3 [Panaeolus papilionaceus]
MPLPPGPVYLLQRLPSLVGPPTAVIVAVKLLNASEYEFPIDIPDWAISVACVLSLPITLFLKVQYKRWKIRREAAAHGAILPPEVKDKWLGGVGLLVDTLKEFKTGYPGDVFGEWVKQYGNTLNFVIFWESRYFTCEPEHIKAILATKFDSYEKGSAFHEQMNAVLGTGVFNSDGEMWKFHRAMTRPFFSKDRISHFDIFDRHATDALNQLSARLQEGHAVDIQDLASRFTMDSATEFLFGHDVRSLSAGLPYPSTSALYNSVTLHPNNVSHPANLFSRAFDEAQRLTALRVRRGENWPLLEFWKDGVKEAMTVVNAFIDPIVKNALDRKRELAQQGNVEKGTDKVKNLADREVKEGETLLDHLINYTDDETVLHDEVLNILLAGRDTTTNSITYSIYMLSKNPNVLRRLRQEVLEKVGPSRRPTFEDMKDMKYLRAVINETLRLYPAVPFNIRTTSKPVVLPGKEGSPPLYIPASSKSPYSVFMMHRREDLWGPDAHQFDPDRFLDSRVKKYLTANPFIFLPFNAGPRICLGQQFAYHETSFFLIRFLQRFRDIKHVEEAQPEGSLPPQAWMEAEGDRTTKGRDRIKMKSYLTMSVVVSIYSLLKGYEC